MAVSVAIATLPFNENSPLEEAACAFPAGCFLCGGA